MSHGSSTFCSTFYIASITFHPFILLSNKSKIFKISIDSSLLNTLSVLLQHYTEEVERINVLLKWVLDFVNFKNLSQQIFSLLLIKIITYYRALLDICQSTHFCDHV